MALNIKTFRESLRVGLSDTVINEFVTKFLSADFTKTTTSNGSKIEEIFKVSEDNKTEVAREDIANFLNRQIKSDYLEARGAYLTTYAESDIEKQKETIAKVSKVLRGSLYSRPNSLTLSSEVILNRPQRDECCHLLTINTDGKNIISVVKAIYDRLRDRGIPFDIEIPKTPNLGDGLTEPIKLHVTTADLEYTIKAISSLDKVYKDKIKTPTPMCANVDNIIGYDSYLDIRGERVSNKLGVVIVKAIDKTIAKLGEGITIDGLSLIDYLKQAENQDLARQACLNEIAKTNENVKETILISAAEVIKEEKIDINPSNIHLSDIASGELNAEYGTIDDPEEEIINRNKVEFETEPEETEEEIILPEVSEKEKKKNALARQVEALKALVADKWIQPAISFSKVGLEQIDSEVAKLAEDTSEVQVPAQTDETIAPAAEPEVQGEPEAPVTSVQTEDPVEAAPAPQADTSITDLQVDDPKVTIVEPMEKTITSEEARLDEVLQNGSEPSSISINPELSEEERMDAMLQQMNITPVVEENVLVQPTEETVTVPVQPTEPVVEPVAEETATPDVEAPVAETTPVGDDYAPVGFGTVDTTKFVFPDFIQKYIDEAKRRRGEEVTPRPEVTEITKAVEETPAVSSNPLEFATKIDPTKFEIPDFVKRAQAKAEPVLLPGEEEAIVEEKHETLPAKEKWYVPPFLKSSKKAEELVQTEEPAIAPEAVGEQVIVLVEDEPAPEPVADTTQSEVVVDNTPTIAPTEEVVAQPEIPVAPVVETTPVETETETIKVAEPIAPEISEEEARLDAMLKTVMDQPQIVVPAEPEAPVEPEPVAEPVAEVTTAPVVETTPAVTEVQQEVAAPTVVSTEPEVTIDEIDIQTTSIPVQQVEPQDDEEDILSAISKATSEENASALSTEEKIAIVADSIPKTEVVRDPVKEAAIAKYNGVSLDPAIYDFQIRDQEENAIMNGDKPYTVLDYLETNNILEIIPLDSRVYLRDDSKEDSVDGRTFIREYVIPNACNGNMSIADIQDYYVKRIAKSDELPEKKKGLFGLLRK